MAAGLENPISHRVYMAKTYNGLFRITKANYPKFTGEEPCASFDVNDFYMLDSDRGNISRVEYSKKICQTCPIIKDCFLWAIHHEKLGVWGGTMEHERRELRKQYKIACTDPHYTDFYLERQEQHDKKVGKA